MHPPFRTDLPAPQRLRGRPLSAERLILNALTTQNPGTSVYLPRPDRCANLNIFLNWVAPTCRRIFGSGNYSVRREGDGYRVWKLSGEGEDTQ